MRTHLHTVKRHIHHPCGILLVVRGARVFHADAVVEVRADEKPEGVPVLDESFHIGEAVKVDERFACVGIVK